MTNQRDGRNGEDVIDAQSTVFLMRLYLAVGWVLGLIAGLGL